MACKIQVSLTQWFMLAPDIVNKTHHFTVRLGFICFQRADHVYPWSLSSPPWINWSSSFPVNGDSHSTHALTMLSFSAPTSCQPWKEGEILCLSFGSCPQEWSITVLKLKWKKKTKALEINVNKDREAHCVVQLGRSVVPDGAVIQLVDIPFYSSSQGISREKKKLSGIPFGRKHLRT